MHMYTWASVQNVAKSASARTWWILLLRSLTRMLPLAVQQSISFPSFFSDLVTRANAARLAVRSSLMKILFCGCSELWSFSLKRDRYTASRSFSLRKRTIITRSRLVLPSFVTFGPRRWLRSRWSGDIGGCSCIDSLITVVINESVSSSDAVEASGMPKNLKFGRREYCSTASEASSRRSILASSFLIVSFLLSTSRVKVSTLLVSVLMESIRFLGNKISLSRFSTLSSFNSSITHNANVSLSTNVCWSDVSLAGPLAGFPRGVYFGIVMAIDSLLITVAPFRSGGYSVQHCVQQRDG